MNNDAPFETVDDALRHAFAFEAKTIIGVTQYADGSIRATDGYSIWDNFAQAGLTMQLASRSLMRSEKAFMLANYTKPMGGKSGLVKRKEASCKRLSFDVYNQIDRVCDRWFVNDVVRGYCGLTRQHSDQWWANHLGVTDRCLRNYKKGRDKKIGIITSCDLLYEKMLQRLEIVFYEAKLIQYVN